jgi:membrane-bound lytic murein transglycosylase A
VKLHEGGVVRLGYDAHNGHSYTPIGRVLVERKIADKAIVTMDYLRGYLAENMDRAKELRAQNKSYVFFRELTELRENEGPIGAQGLPVTAWRTLAVDKSQYTYGTPVFVSANLPLLDMQAGAPFSQLMIAQDTGSAIRGIARGDLYLGSGLEAGFMAGNIKHKVTWIVLIPNKLVKP